MADNNEKGKGLVNRLPSAYQDIHTDLLSVLSENIPTARAQELENRLLKATSPEARSAAETARDQYYSEFHQKVARQASQQMNTLSKFGNINTLTTTMSRSSSYMIDARDVNNPYIGMTTESLDQLINRNQKQISTITRQISGYMSEITEDNPSFPQLEQLKREAAQGYNETARLKAAKIVQRQKGLTTEQIYRSSEEFLESQSGKVESRELRQKIRGMAESGDIGSSEQEFINFKKSIADVQTALEAWKDASQLSTEAIKRLNESTDEVAKINKELNSAKDDQKNDIRKRLQDAESRQSEASRIKEETAQQLESTKEYLDEAKQKSKEAEIRTEYARDRVPGGRVQAAVGLLSPFASAASTIALDQELEQMNLRTAYAGIVNRQYKDQDAMAKGDMSAFLRLANSDAIAKAYADSMGGTAVGLKGTEAILQIVDAAALGFGAYKTKDPNMAVASAGSAAGGLVQGSRLVKGLTGGGYGYQGYQTTMNFLNTVQEIGADTMQSYFDYKTGTYTAGTGLGGNRAKFMADMSSDVSKFAALGVDPTEALQLAQAGVQAFGGQGNMSQLVQRAGVAELRGIMNRGQYVQAAGALAGVGGGVSDLESIMTKAVAAGMDNAKNVQQMVAATTQLAAAGGAAGFNVAGATENILASSVQNLVDAGVNKNLATGAATSAFMNASNAAAMKGTLGDLISRAETEGIYGPMDIDTSAVLSNLTAPEIETLLRGGEEAYDSAKRLRINKVIGLKEDGTYEEGYKEKMRKFQRTQMRKTLSNQVRLGFEGRSAKIQEEMIDVKLEKKDAADASDETVRAFAAGTNNEYIASYTIGGAREAATAPTEAENKAGMSLPEGMRYGTGEEGAVQRFIRQGTQRKGEKIGTGQDKFGEMGGLAGVVEAMSKILEMTPDKMEKAAAKAAENLSAPGTLYKEGSGLFKTAVDKFVAHVEKVTGEKVVNSTKSEQKDQGTGQKGSYHKGVFYPYQS